jgi:hypothetical protein
VDAEDAEENLETPMADFIEALFLRVLCVLRGSMPF